MLNSLSNIESLTYIELEGNDIGDEGLKHMCELACKNANITTLRLGRANISDKGAKYACETLRGNRSVISLDLLDNPEHPYVLTNSITNVGAEYLDELAKNSSIMIFDYPNKSQGTIKLLNDRVEFIIKLGVRWVGGREVSCLHKELESCKPFVPYLEKLYKYSSSIKDSFDIMTTQVMMRHTSGGYISGSPYYFEYEARRYENLAFYLSCTFGRDLEEKYKAIKNIGYNFLQVYGIAGTVPNIFVCEDVILLISRYLDSTYIKLHDVPVCASIINVQAVTQSCTQVYEASNPQYKGI